MQCFWNNALAKNITNTIPAASITPQGSKPATTENTIFIFFFFYANCKKVAKKDVEKYDVVCLD